MRAGSLRHTITVESFTSTANDFGEIVETWAPFATVKANINPLNGSEKYVSSTRHATATHQITARYLGGVSPKMRIIFGTRIFTIVSVLNMGERNKMLQIIAEEVIA